MLNSSKTCVMRLNRHNAVLHGNLWKGLLGVTDLQEHHIFQTCNQCRMKDEEVKCH